MQLSVFQLPIHSFVSIKMNAVKWLDSIGVAHIKGRDVLAFPDFVSMKKKERTRNNLHFGGSPMHNFRAVSRALLFAAIIPTIPLLVTGTRALAQSDTSSISGTVTDPSGAVVPNAKVTARNDATGQARTVTTNSVGAYTITNVSSGNYTVTVESQGFQTAVQQGAHVDPSIGAQVNVSLKSGNATTTETVQSNANRLETE